MSTTTPIRYNSIAIALHWVMALGFIMMLGSGIAMGYFDLDKSLKFQMYQWHKSGGVLLLIAAVLRLGWKLFSIAPALPASMPQLEKIAAKIGHIALYVLMFALPISGWVMVSSSIYGLPTIVFGAFEWPHIPGIQGNELYNKVSKSAHFFLAIAFGLAIFGHIAAVIKHALIDKENLLTRMWWSAQPKD